MVKIGDLDKPKPEVVIDIAILQVSRDRLRTLGVNPPTSANVVMIPGTGAQSGDSGGSGSNGSFTINSLGNLTANNFHVSIPGASLSYLMSDSDTKLIQNPEIRALDNEKATLKIGEAKSSAAVGVDLINQAAGESFQTPAVWVG